MSDITLKEKLIFGVNYGVTLLAIRYSKLYHGPMEQLVSGYMEDVTGPMCLYFCAKLLTLSRNSAAALVFGGCSSYEIAQGVGLQGGMYDPYDFVAYAAGTGLAVGVDRLMFGSRNLEKRLV